MMKTMMKTGLVALALTSAATFSGCQANPATGRMQFTPMPAAQVAALGDEAKPQLVHEYGGEHPNAAVRQYVNEVGQSLARHVEPEFADIQWTFTVLDSEIINAFALPGGHVFISRGLLAEFDNEAQLAGVLGHEIGHVTGRHIDERLGQQMAVQGIVAAVGGLTESQLAVLAAQVATGGYQLKFGRDQESEADILGVRYMVNAGYDPQGMLQVLEVLQRAAGAGRTPEFLSTHPHPETRIRTVTRLLETDYAHTRNNPQYQLHPQRFQQIAPQIGSAAGSHPGALAIMAIARGGYTCCGGH